MDANIFASQVEQILIVDFALQGETGTRPVSKLIEDVCWIPHGF